MQIQLEKIPQYLKANGQFCNWKYELRDGNQTKGPYMQEATRKTSVNSPATFTALDVLIHCSFIGAVELPQKQKKST